jgi:hypothetical protein
VLNKYLVILNRINFGEKGMVRTSNLLRNPATLQRFPFIVALKPIFATDAADMVNPLKILVSLIFARRANSVSVAPGHRAVTVTPVPRNSIYTGYLKRYTPW